MRAEEFDAGIWDYRATLRRIKDADTLVLLVDTGFRGRHEPAVRLARCDAPERGTPAGKAAFTFVYDLLRGGMEYESLPPVWGLRVRTVQRETVVEEVTSFERWVAEVWRVDADGTMLNLSDALIAAGHATRV